MIDSIQADLGVNEGSYDADHATTEAGQHGNMEASTSMSAGSSKAGAARDFSSFGAASSSSTSGGNAGSGNKRDRSTLLESVGG